MEVKIKFFSENAKMPTKAHKDDFCYDLVATSCEEVAPNIYKYGLGIGLQLSDKIREVHNKVGKRGAFSIRPRSSVWKTGMILSNCIGTIDEGYIGEISAVFYHVMPNMPRYKVGDKICQLHYDLTTEINFIDVDNLSYTERGDNGYGSSDKEDVSKS